MKIDLTRPSKLYRYSEKRWLERSIDLGEFLIKPASVYKKCENDRARHDNELVRIHKAAAKNVNVTVVSTGKQIQPVGEVIYRSEVGTNYYAICFSDRWDEMLFDEFQGTDACLVIHDVEEFGERFHAAAESALPGWTGLDAPVSYGGNSNLGPVFSKPLRFITQHEWRFAWIPTEGRSEHPEAKLITLGSIAAIAEIRARPIR